MAVLQKYGIWVAIVVMSLVFAAVGIAKLMGVEQLHELFARFGLPAWFAYFIGVSEIAGAVGLYVRKLSALAAAGLAIIMVGAIGFHAAFDPLQMAVPAAVLLILSGIVVAVRRKDGFWTAPA